MVFGDDTLLESVDAAGARVGAAAVDRVTLVGRVGHDEMPNYYAAADVFISGSHYEGSGYALIEAMSAGVVPVVTDIPSFRAIAGDAASDGRPETPTNSRACWSTCARRISTARKAAAKARFDRVLSWEAIGATHRRGYRAARQARDAMKIAIVVPGGLHPSGQRSSRAVVAGAVRAAGAVARDPRVRAEASSGAANLFAAVDSPFTISAGRRRRSD